MDTTAWKPTIIRVEDARSEDAYIKIQGSETIWDRSNKTRYVKPSSNKQIQTIFKTYTADKYKLLYLLARHNIMVTPQEAARLQDSQIYGRIKPADKKPNAERDQGQADHLYYHLRCGILDKYSPPFANYIDIGGDTGGISVCLGKKIGAECVTVVDPASVGRQNTPGATYLANLSSVADKSQDLATCIFSIHHFDNLDQMLADIARVVKPGGLLMIKEHDCWNAIDAMMVDIEHSLFMTAHGERITDTHTLHFMNHVGWEHTLATAGFQLIHWEYFSSPREEVTPTRAFTAVFRRS